MSENRAGKDIMGTKENPMWIQAQYVLDLNWKPKEDSPKDYRGKVDIVVFGRYYAGCYYRNSESNEESSEEEKTYDIHLFVKGIKPEGYYRVWFDQEDIRPFDQKIPASEVLETLKKDPQAFLKRQVRI